jgi:hypothetical protein
MQPKEVAVHTLETLCHFDGLFYLLVVITKHNTGMNHSRTDNFISIPANDSSYRCITLH